MAGVARTREGNGMNAASFDECGFRPADTPCWCGWDDEQDDPAVGRDEWFDLVPVPWWARLQWWLWDHEFNRLGNLISDFRYWTWRAMGGKHYGE